MLRDFSYIFNWNVKHISIKLILLLGLLIIVFHCLTSENRSPNFIDIFHSQQKICAFIISGDCNSLRYNTTKDNLERAFPKFFLIRCFPSISLNDSRIHTSDVLLWKKFSSNLLTFIDLWTKEISPRNDSEWSFIFEDDVNFTDPSIVSLSNYIASLEELMHNPKIRDKDGFFYLGICGPQFVNDTKSMNVNHSLSSQRGYGYCLHATGITAKRSRSLWSEIASYRPNAPDRALDSQLREYTIRSGHYYYTLGSNIHYPPGTGHYGIAYQDRGRFPSTI